LGRIDILGDAERGQLLVEWNDTDRDVAAATFPELFEAQATRSPDAPAVLFEGGALTYAELDARANRLARPADRGGAGRSRSSRWRCHGRSRSWSPSWR